MNDSLSWHLVRVDGVQLQAVCLDEVLHPSHLVGRIASVGELTRQVRQQAVHPDGLEKVQILVVNIFPVQVVHQFHVGRPFSHTIIGKSAAPAPHL